ncbi:hypothetical protein GTA51_17235 [Desulfovibrio aerotolerans]|uniref:Uncharacterized protein n=1 Tax=Solidesulfovibrio aerotolerans TaxID=295255 RepID=A0A7C9IQ10_9BACT|nr:hypothetical protein [Solidesulfovibrio aerotolerans]MYL84859.1 hypothetical protein [Solidesulfovibrio aerotolerans]
MDADFRPEPRLRLMGDTALLAPLRRAALRELAVMHQENVFDLPVYQRSLELETGERILCRRAGDQDFIEIIGARGGATDEAEVAPPAQPPRRDDEFYVIPECLARYDGLDSLQNTVPDGALAGWTLGLGAGVTIVAADAAGLPAYAGLPQAGIERAVGVFRLPGGAASGILYGREHIPDEVPFSVSCLVRLTAPLAYDYTFDARGVLNPIRPYLLRTDDGAAFVHDCPGALSPLIGFCSPYRNPNWEEDVTYPWSPWNDNYAADPDRLQGARRAGASCDGAPLLRGDSYRDAQGNPYPHPDGFVMGLQAAGVFVADGNRLLGARLSHFESQFGTAVPVSDPLEIGLWHHVVMTHALDGTVRLYVTRQDQAQGAAYAGTMPLCALDAACTYQASGVNAWTLRNGPGGEAIAAYRMNPAMDVALPRFFHYALSPAQAWLLSLEALSGLFVADDHEAAQALALGLTPIVIEKEVS